MRWSCDGRVVPDIEGEFVDINEYNELLNEIEDIKKKTAARCAEIVLSQDAIGKPLLKVAEAIRREFNL